MIYDKFTAINVTGIVRSKEQYAVCDIRGLSQPASWHGGCRNRIDIGAVGTVGGLQSHFVPDGRFDDARVY